RGSDRKHRSDDCESSAKYQDRPSHVSCLLEGVRGMGAEDERGLEKELVHGPRAAAVEIEAVTMSAVRALVRRPEAEELGRPETDVGLDRPLGARVLRVLRPVEPKSAGPATPGLHFAAQVPAP